MKNWTKERVNESFKMCRVSGDCIEVRELRWYENILSKLGLL